MILPLTPEQSEKEETKIERYKGIIFMVSCKFTDVNNDENKFTTQLCAYIKHVPNAKNKRSTEDKQACEEKKRSS
jgi:hypothetical protein